MGTEAAMRASLGGGTESLFVTIYMGGLCKSSKFLITHHTVESHPQTEKQHRTADQKHQQYHLFGNPFTLPTLMHIHHRSFSNT